MVVEMRILTLSLATANCWLHEYSLHAVAKTKNCGQAGPGKMGICAFCGNERYFSEEELKALRVPVERREAPKSHRRVATPHAGGASQLTDPRLTPPAWASCRCSSGGTVDIDEYRVEKLPRGNKVIWQTWHHCRQGRCSECEGQSSYKAHKQEFTIHTRCDCPCHQKRSSDVRRLLGRR